MRLSANKDDPGYAAYRSLPSCVRPLVFVDGAEVSHVLTADTKTGYVLAADVDAEGKFQLNAKRDGVKHKQLRGKVDVIFSEWANPAHERWDEA